MLTSGVAALVVGLILPTVWSTRSKDSDAVSPKPPLVVLLILGILALSACGATHPAGPIHDPEGQVDDLTAYRLEPTGLGPLRVGTPMADVLARGWGDGNVDGMDCMPWTPSMRLTKQGVHFGPDHVEHPDLAYVSVTSREITSAGGAQVGMTLDQLEDSLGDRLTSEIKDTNGGPLTIHYIRSGEHEIVFWFDSYDQPSTGVVQSMTAREYSPGLYGGC